MADTTDETKQRPLTYPADAVLTRAQVAEWLGVSERSVFRMGIKQTPQRRYLAKWVYDYLEEIAA